MPKPLTNTFKDGAGNQFESETVLKGIVKNWAEEDIVSLINAPVSAEAITDAEGKIVRYEYLKTQFGGITDRKVLVEQDRTGHVSAEMLTGSKITVDIDDERSTNPFYIDNWDAKKLSTLVGLKANKEGEYQILPRLERAERYFEKLRTIAKAAEAAALGDGVTRVVDTTGKDAEGLYDLYAEAVEQQASVKNSNRKGTPLMYLALILPPKHIRLISKLYWKTGSPETKNAIEKGGVGAINGVTVYSSINTPGATEKQGFLVIRGALVMPLANPEVVQYPSKSNSFKGAFEWATCKPNSAGVLYPSGVVAFGKPAEINA